MSDRDYLMSRVVIDADGCWIWTGYVTADGYGRASRTRSTSTIAHRVAYEVFVGPIPDGLTLDHLCHSVDPVGCPGGLNCKHRRCVNPAHLEPISHRENSLRGVLSQLTHCKWGHPFDEANTYRRSQNGQGQRDCRTCTARRQHEYQARRKARAAA